MLLLRILPRFGGAPLKHMLKKICKVMDMAVKMGAPKDRTKRFRWRTYSRRVRSLGYADTFVWNACYDSANIGYYGPCAGGAVYSPPWLILPWWWKIPVICLWRALVVVKTVTNETVTSEGAGGASTHSTKSGGTYYFCKWCRMSEDLKKLLSYLPQK
jgi:acetyl-CoA carboxylase carboxyltransferase component